MSKIKELLALLKSSKAINTIVLLVIVAAIPLTVFIAQKQQETRQRASGPITAPLLSPTLNIFGKAILFAEGTKSYVSINPTRIFTEGPFTIEAWVKTPKPDSGSYIRDFSLLTYIKPQSPYDFGYIFRLSLEVQEISGESRPLFSALIGDSYSSLNSNYIGVGGPTGKTLKPDTWNHIAIVSYSENNICNLKLYINGYLADSSQKYNPNCKISILQPQQLTIAKPPQSLGGIAGYYYVGQIDEVRISNINRYPGSFVTQPAPFVKDDNTLGLWYFDGDVNDSSGNNNNGQVFGNAQYADSTIGIFPAITPTQTPFVCSACSADINKNGSVDAFDFTNVSDCRNRTLSDKDRYGKSCALADINKDGNINDIDYSCVQSKLGQRCIALSPTLMPTIISTPSSTLTPTRVNTPTPIQITTPTKGPKNTPSLFVCTACAADIKKDSMNRVNAADYAVLASCYGKSLDYKLSNRYICANADVNKDGKINESDYSCIKEQYSKTCAP